MKNYWKINEDGKSELYFDFETFKSLPDADKKEIKAYYLWSRGKGAWVSKLANNTTRTEKIASRTGLSFMGASKSESSFNYRTNQWIKSHFDFIGKSEWSNWGKPKDWTLQELKDFYIDEEGVESLGDYPSETDSFYNEYWDTARKDVQSVYDDLTFSTENVPDKDKRIIHHYLDTILKIVKGEAHYSKTLIVDAFMRKLVKMPLSSKLYAVDMAKQLQDRERTTIFNSVHKFWKVIPEQKIEEAPVVKNESSIIVGETKYFEPNGDQFLVVDKKGNDYYSVKLGDPNSPLFIESEESINTNNRVYYENQKYNQELLEKQNAAEEKRLEKLKEISNNEVVATINEKGLSPMELGKLNSYLDKQLNYPNIGVYSLREMINAGYYVSKRISSTFNGKTTYDFILQDGFLNQVPKIVYDNVEFTKIGNELQGGISDNLTVDDIAKKHNVSTDFAREQFIKGIAVELEHTDKEEIASEIALDHLSESINYYIELEKMEDKLKQDESENTDKKYVWNYSYSDITKHLKDSEIENFVEFSKWTKNIGVEGVYYNVPKRSGEEFHIKIEITPPIKRTFGSNKKYRLTAYLQSLDSISNSKELFFKDFDSQYEAKSYAALIYYFETELYHLFELKEEENKNFKTLTEDEIISLLSETAAKSKNNQDFFAKVRTNQILGGVNTNSEEFIRALGLTRCNPEGNMKILHNFYMTLGLDWKKRKKIERKESVQLFEKEKANVNVENIVSLANEANLKNKKEEITNEIYKIFQEIDFSGFLVKVDVQSNGVIYVEPIAYSDKKFDGMIMKFENGVWEVSEFQANGGESINVFIETESLKDAVESFVKGNNQHVSENINTNKSKIDDILESDFFKENILDIEQENKDLADAGWSRDDIKNMADFVGKQKDIQDSKNESFESEGNREGKGLLYEFFTPQIVADKMFALAQKYGFNGGSVLEPAAGNGRLLKYAKNCDITAFEINDKNVQQLKNSFPNAEIYNFSFERAFLKEPRFNSLLDPKAIKTWLKKAPFDLVLANPPYGKYSGLYSSYFKFNGQFEHFFILQTLKVLKSGGIGVYLIPSSFMRNGDAYNEVKKQIFEIAKLADAYRLPSNIFKDTQIGTDIIVLIKK